MNPMSRDRLLRLPAWPLPARTTASISRLISRRVQEEPGLLLTWNQGYRRLPQCRAHAEGGELLLEAAPRPSSRAPGQGPPRTVPEGLLWQERLRQA